MCSSDLRTPAVPPKVDQALSAYDAAITSDPTTPVAKLDSAVTFDGTAGSPFDFGATFGDVTMEFIVQGDPVATAGSGYLAVGENSGSSLRYEQNPNTLQMGFTQSGIADYLFTPAVPSPTRPTHVTYVWSTAELMMRLYVDGVLAGTTTDVFDFGLPTGPGFLGSNPGGAEVMVGTIYRVTVYQDILPEDAIQRHADAFVDVLQPTSIASFTATPAIIDAQASAVLDWEVQNATTLLINDVPVTGTTQTVSPPVTTTYTLVAANDVTTNSARVTVYVNPPLGPYDAAIAADAATGLAPVVVSTNAVTLTGAGGEPFDFGFVADDVTIEFILEGDPEATGGSGYLAVGENTTSSLRYEQWQDTHQLGFTQSGVADYNFVPGAPSPTIATHVAYVWNAATFSMTLYVNGVSAGTITGVSDAFTMPSGMGFLGANATGGEQMIGRVHRVVVYDDIVPEAAIQRHADAFTSVLQPPIIASFTATPAEIIGQGSATLNWQVQNAAVVFLNGANVTTVTNQVVSPAVTTSYTLIASNNISSVSSRITVLVTPQLDDYDAAIAADTAAGLTPLVTLTEPVTLTGAGNVPFDFGFSSGDVTIEFILEGDPEATGDSGYLAVGENSGSNLRYDQWQDTREMGFTQLGVADYLFTPTVPSPTVPTHVTYAWNATELSMTLYINGVLAGTSTGVSDTFAMPMGAGFLGANAGGTEAMVGRILRIVVYDELVPEATIQRHGATLPAGVPSAPELSLVVSGSQPTLTLEGVAGTHYRVEYRDSLAASDTWQLLQDVPSLSGTTLSVVDPTATTGRSQRFYRAIVPQ